MAETPKEAAMAAATRLEQEAADFAARSRAKLEEAAAARAPHCNWIERQMYAASAELACWDPAKVRAFREHFGANEKEASHG